MMGYFAMLLGVILLVAILCGVVLGMRTLHTLEEEGDDYLPPEKGGKAQGEFLHPEANFAPSRRS